MLDVRVVTKQICCLPWLPGPRPARLAALPASLAHLQKLLGGEAFYGARALAEAGGDFGAGAGLHHAEPAVAELFRAAREVSGPHGAFVADVLVARGATKAVWMQRATFLCTPSLNGFYLISYLAFSEILKLERCERMKIL